VFAGSWTLVNHAPPEEAAKAAPLELEERLTEIAELLVVALPKLSSSVTLKALPAEELAVALNAVEVMANDTPAPPVMVSTWLPLVRPVADALMDGDPVTVSP
jgi:hypothetical protein